MTLALLFAIGVVEYGLATLWTRMVAAKRAGGAAAVAFVNVMIWGVVVNLVSVGDPLTLTVHAGGCAVGAAMAVYFAAD